MDRIKNFAVNLICLPLAIVILPIEYFRDVVARRTWPKTLEQAVDRLTNALSETDLELIRLDNANIDWYSIGQFIRNSFGLWGGNKSLLNSCGVSDHPHAADEASGIIIGGLKRRLAQNDNAR